MPLIPHTHRAVIHTSPKEPLTVQDVSIPDVGPGSAVVEILATPLPTYTADIINGTRPYPMVYPLTPGASAIARGTSSGAFHFRLESIKLSRI